MNEGFEGGRPTDRPPRPTSWGAAGGDASATPPATAPQAAPHEVGRGGQSGRQSTGQPLFPTFFLGGFECSSHRNLAEKRRLDLIASTQHDRWCREDYARLKSVGIGACRDGIRWHLIETAPYRYDWSSVLPMVRAARNAGVRVIWDLCHYGWPDDLDVFSPEFLPRFDALTRAFVRLLNAETDEAPYLSPMNEISFVAWAGGEVAILPPFARECGRRLKWQLCKAALVATEAAWETDARSRLFHIDPICNVVPSRPEDAASVDEFRMLMYEAWDILAGYEKPELGGSLAHLDVVGVNYYRDNQWEFPGTIDSETTIGEDDPRWVRPWTIIREAYERYGRPIFVAETGIEDDRRGPWLRHIGAEARAALRAGVPLEGVCLYPILNHLGWEDDRHCQNGLWDFADERGERPICEPLARELRRQVRWGERMRRER